MFNVHFWFAVTSFQLKEELLDGEEYSFLQGTSDHESNGSASYYIKQEPWAAPSSEGHSTGDRKRTFLQDWLILFPLGWCSSGDCAWRALQNVDELDSVPNFLEGRGNYFSEKDFSIY